MTQLLTIDALMLKARLTIAEAAVPLAHLPNGPGLQEKVHKAFVRLAEATREWGRVLTEITGESAELRVPVPEDAILSDIVLSALAGARVTHAAMPPGETRDIGAYIGLLNALHAAADRTRRFEEALSPSPQPLDDGPESTPDL